MKEVWMWTLEHLDERQLLKIHKQARIEVKGFRTLSLTSISLAKKKLIEAITQAGLKRNESVSLALESLYGLNKITGYRNATYAELVEFVKKGDSLTGIFIALLSSSNQSLCVKAKVLFETCRQENLLDQAKPLPTIKKEDQISPDQKELENLKKLLAESQQENRIARIRTKDTQDILNQTKQELTKIQAQLQSQEEIWIQKEQEWKKKEEDLAQQLQLATDHTGHAVKNERILRHQHQTTMKTVIQLEKELANSQRYNQQLESQVLSLQEQLDSYDTPPDLYIIGLDTPVSITWSGNIVQTSKIDFTLLMKAKLIVGLVFETTELERTKADKIIRTLNEDNKITWFSTYTELDDFLHSL